MTPTEWFLSLTLCHPDHVRQDGEQRPKMSPTRLRTAAAMALVADPATLEVNVSQARLAEIIASAQGNISHEAKHLMKTGWLSLARDRVVGQSGSYRVYRLSRPEDFYEQYLEAAGFVSMARSRKPLVDLRSLIHGGPQAKAAIEWLFTLTLCHPDHVRQSCEQKARAKMSASRMRTAAAMALLADPATFEVSLPQAYIAGILTILYKSVNVETKKLREDGWLTLTHEKRSGRKDSHFFYRLSRPADYWARYGEALGNRFDTSVRWDRKSLDSLKRILENAFGDAGREAGEAFEGSVRTKGDGTAGRASSGGRDHHPLSPGVSA